MPIKTIVLSLVVLIAIAGAVAAVPLGGGSGDQSEDAPSPGDYDIDRTRHAVSVDGHVVDADGLMVTEGTNANAAIGTSSVANPWGCVIRAHHPHESTIDPGAGYVQAKATIECSTTPPAHTANIWQELSKWEGSNFTIEAVKTSYCPSGVGDPDCYPTLNGGVLMRGYINAPCEIGTTRRYVHLALGQLTVDGVTYSGLTGSGRDVDCDG